MKTLLKILVISTCINLSGQVTQETINLGKDDPEYQTELLFKYNFSARYYQKRFQSAGLIRNIEIKCLDCKWKYSISINQSDFFKWMPRKKRLIIPYRMQLKIKAC